jgi:hypothetical protein
MTGGFFHTRDRQQFFVISSPSRSSLPIDAGLTHSCPMGTKSRESIYGASIRASAELAKEVRKEADKLACVAWNQRMLGFKGPAQPSPSLGDALNAGYRYLEVRCLGCDTHQTVALDIVRRPKVPSTNWSDICVARIARRFVAILSSGAISLRSVQPRFRPSTWWPGER